MKKILFFSLVVFLTLSLTGFAMAAEEEAKAEGPVLLVQLLTLVIVGGILYNLWVNMTGFGGQLGQAIKVIGAGVFVLSIGTIDEVVEGLSGIGSETLLGDGLLHSVFHDGVILLGFFIVGFGLSKLTKLVKSMK